MIKIKGLSLSYGDNKILENINLEISSPGIYLLYGESGSGKSSLLNIISLMENKYMGEYYFFDEDVSLLNEERKQELRFSKITYLFQIPKLIEGESIKVNLEIALGRKMEKIEEDEFKKKIRMNNLNKRISSLSGGEKQRVNILMGILRNTPLLLGDEITSGLDEVNKKVVMSLLKEEGKKRVIILVSHDLEFISQYAKEVRRIDNKTIEPLKKCRGKIESIDERKDNKLPLKYSFKHVLNTISRKKLRALISIFSSTIALVCLGICLILTSTLRDTFMANLGSIINENQIVMERKESTFLIDEPISISLNDIKKIMGRYPRDIGFLGVHYLDDIDLFFEDENYFSFYHHDTYYNIQNLTVNDINKYRIINKENKDLFYLTKNELQEDEIVLSFTHGEISRICQYLSIEYVDDSSLMNYLLNEPLLIKLNLQNEEWEYILQSDLYLVGYTIDNERAIYHTSSIWNEYMIEEVMQLVSSLSLNEIDKYPWSVKKEYYLYVNEETITSLINKLISDQHIDDFTPRVFRINEGFGISFLYTHNNLLKVHEVNEIVNNNAFIESYIPCSKKGYNAVKDVLISGFTYPSFVSSDYELLEEYINLNSYSEENLGAYQGTLMSLSNKSLVSLGLLDATKDNFCFIKLLSKSEEKNLKYDEICISKGLALSLGIDLTLTNNTIFFLTLTSVDYANGKYKNNFEIVPLKIVKIIDEDEDKCFYVNYLWTITFLMCNFESDNPGIDKVIFNYSGRSMDNDLSFLNDNYPDYIFSNPYREYAKNIDEVSSYLTVGLSIFSSFCLISTLLMLIVSSGLFIAETKKEIGIYSLYGYEKKSIKNLYIIFSYLMSIYSYLISFFSLIVMYILFTRGDYGIRIASFSAIIKPSLIMLLVSLIIGTISGRTTTRRVFKENPFKQLYDSR